MYQEDYIWSGEDFSVDPDHATEIREKVFSVMPMAEEPSYLKYGGPEYLTRRDRLHPGGTHIVFIPLPFWTDLDRTGARFPDLPEGVTAALGNCQTILLADPHFLSKDGTLIPPNRIPKDVRDELDKTGDGTRYFAEGVTTAVAITFKGEADRLLDLKERLSDSGVGSYRAEDRGEGLVLKATFDQLRFERASRYGFFHFGRLMDRHWDCPPLRPVAGGGGGPEPAYFVTRVAAGEGDPPPYRVRGRLLSLDFVLPDGSRLLKYRIRRAEEVAPDEPPSGPTEEQAKPAGDEREAAEKGGT